MAFVGEIPKCGWFLIDETFPHCKGTEGRHAVDDGKVSHAKHSKVNVRLLSGLVDNLTNTTHQVIVVSTYLANRK